jgi:hypothetical protein
MSTMQSIRYVYWQDGDAWLGHLEEYPDYLTQGSRCPTWRNICATCTKIYRAGLFLPCASWLNFRSREAVSGAGLSRRNWTKADLSRRSAAKAEAKAAALRTRGNRVSQADSRRWNGAQWKILPREQFLTHHIVPFGSSLPKGHKKRLPVGTFPAFAIRNRASMEIIFSPRSISPRYFGFRSALSANSSWVGRHVLRRGCRGAKKP